MATEEQTTNGGYAGVRAEYPRQGQRLTISNRIVTKLGFYIGKLGTISGDVDFKIRSVSDDGVLLTKLWGDAADLPVSLTYKEVTFDSPTTIDEEVRISCEFSGGSAGNLVKIWISASDVKADEVYSYYTDSWTDDSGYDLLYIYTYTADSATVTTQTCTSVAETTATGNGTITDLGNSSVTQHGHCWNTSTNPTTSNDKTTKGTGYLGTFISDITSLSANTLYYVRAYATNSFGTAYGANVTFTSSTADTPTVTTKACSALTATTATGNGIITSIGDSGVSQHGHCWNTSVNPTTSNSKTLNGGGYVGAFTSAITGLTEGTTYYIRAYATNTAGTSYGDNVLIITGTGGGELAGPVAVVETRLHYVDKYGQERYIEGTPI